MSKFVISIDGFIGIKPKFNTLIEAGYYAGQVAESKGLDTNRFKAHAFPLELDDLVTYMKQQILEDIGDGRVPCTVASFSELHGYVDANCYGDLCDDWVTDAYIAEYGGRDEHEGVPEGYINLINAAQTAVDSWLKEKENGKA